MIKRIKKIQNIGRFRNSKPANLQFGEVNIVFGRNTYGKSTLGDIFVSLQQNDLSRIKSRLSIPFDGKKQEIEISFQNKSNSEDNIKLRDDYTWSSELPDNLKLFVFDDGFYHNNVFAARQFTRSTKENFSTFILGEQGVSKAQEISSLKKVNRELTNEKNKIVKHILKDIPNVDDFIKIVPDFDLNTYKKLLAENIAVLNNILKKKNETNDILRRDIFSSQGTISSLDFFDRLNDCFSSSLNTVHEDARIKLMNHIENNFNEPETAEKWIRDGLEQTKSTICSFCGSDISQEKNDLLDIYQLCFDESFNNHAELIEDSLIKGEEALSNFNFNQITSDISLLEKVILLYPELSDDCYFDSITKSLKLVINDILDQICKWDEIFNKICNDFTIKIDQKKKSPNKSIAEINLTDLTLCFNIIEKKYISMKKISEELNTIISDYKNSLAPEKIKEEITRLTAEQEDLNIKLKRIELDSYCNKIIANTKMIDQGKQKVSKYQEELNLSQSTYLDKYFDQLNQNFKLIGSKDFNLVLASNSAGNTPIYYLQVEFREKRIPEKELDKVFSESDRRALALSVFLTQVSCLSNEDKLNSIIILDDPVTSFDNNRITSVHREIVKLSKEIKQLIVLSHYEYDVSKFLKTYKKNMNIVFFIIENLKGESILSYGDSDFFMMNDHERSRDNILSFISEEVNELKNDLRVFLEMEIKLRFAKQINDNNIKASSLSELIDELFNISAISKEIKDDCHSWRTCLNPTHHTWTGDDIEDTRSTANTFMEFIYKKLSPIA